MLKITVIILLLSIIIPTNLLSGALIVITLTIITAQQVIEFYTKNIKHKNNVAKKISIYFPSIAPYHLVKEKKIKIVLLSLALLNPITNHYPKNLAFNILLPTMLVSYGMIGTTIILISKYIHPIKIEVLPRILATHLLFLTKHLLNIEVEVKGKASPNSIIAAEHQSILEIIILAKEIEGAKFILKKELLLIPFFGYCVKELGMIAINRKGHNPEWINKAEEHLKNGKTIIIFPEGKRVKYGEIAEYKPGVFKLAQKTNKPITPAYTNTGQHWPKYAIIKTPGKVFLIFGEEIKQKDSIEENKENLRKKLKALVCKSIDK